MRWLRQPSPLVHRRGGIEREPVPLRGCQEGCGHAASLPGVCDSGEKAGCSGPGLGRPWRRAARPTPVGACVVCAFCAHARHLPGWLLECADRPGHRGAPPAPPGVLQEAVTALDALGLQTHTHATGDGGVRLALDAIEAAARTNGTRDRRHGIVHVECLSPADLPRFAALGVVAAMQPRHCSPDLVAGTWMENVGQARWDRAWRLRSLAASGAHVALSSDWQVGEMDPLVGVYSAMTRAGLDGSAAWTPDERLTLEQALRGYTAEGAWAWHAEGDLGVLRVGAKADLVVWSDDLYAHAEDSAALLEQQAALTVVGGEVVHDVGSSGPGGGGAEPGVGHYGAVSHCSAHQTHGVPA
ncbi:amidohydrolase family protein [Quadrisphaera sp. RL12-1S]|nr:amidohydrolase family protein [Quadrisphaera sp. RL12-1S]MBC3764170.1 amidohydrolase family protein [Quadrisphaera sp. RL12-1S]